MTRLFMETKTGEIVLIDDTPEDCFLAERLIEEAHAAAVIRTFDSSADAIEYLTELSGSPARPGVFFIDIRMPQLNGFEVLEWIRSQPAFDAVPAIMLSSSDEPRDLEQAKALRADCYLKKLPSVEEMQRVLDCARRYERWDPSGRVGFALPCNLLSTL
jgi:CheY-like chemotaxis protein